MPQLIATPNQWLYALVPSSQEGRFAIVTDVEAGCDGRGGAQDERSLLADGEVVWFWRSEAGAKLAGHDPADDGGNQAMVTEESTKETVKPLRREGRMIRCTPGC